MLNVVTVTHPGAVRPTNEDVVLWDADLGLIAVADGMGGHNAGEVASRMAVDEVRAMLQADLSKDGWPFGFVESLGVHGNRVHTAILAANRKVFAAGRKDAAHAGMGTTLTVALIEDRTMWLGSVGDSRLYIKPAGGALQLRTHDDSVVDLLRQDPAIKTLAMLNRPMQHLLTSAIGPKPEISVEIQTIELSDGDLLLLTTDGMHGPVGDEVMDMILDDGTLDLQIAANHLLDAALGAGGRDNITIALGRFTRG
ncbi:MAG TPA: protein phosphatase 2C domain-containing protein [Vicinamibacterales bacterium]|jgi:protein phosphatase|nr:protein phosphatase 2C domain-containing protein [Vicinamibacterales bacterium]